MDKEQQAKLLTEIVETNQKNGLYEDHIGDTNKMVTAVEWFIEKTTESGHLWITDKPNDMLELAKLIQQAKEMEKEKEHELKQLWFGRGILAAKEDRISELKPKRK